MRVLPRNRTRTTRDDSSVTSGYDGGVTFSRAHGAIVLAATLALACSPPFLSGEGNPSLTPIDPNPVFTFAGRVVSTQTGAPVSGATVAASGASVTTSGDGSFSLEVDAEATPATITAPGFLTRATSLAGGGTRTDRTVDLISTDPPFNIEYFDRLTRGFAQPEFPDFVLHWSTNPNFYVITRYTELLPDGTRQSSGVDVPQADLDRVPAMIPGMVTGVSGGRLSAGAVQFRPDYRKDVEAGWIQVAIGERAAGLSGLCGLGGVTITSQGSDITNEISRTGFAQLFIAPECACGAALPSNVLIAHEIGHALGLFHADPFTESLMLSAPQIDCNTTTLPASDAYHAALSHTRPVGNRRPDNDPSHFSLLSMGGPREATLTFSCGLP
jgi:hypothetical protein